MEDVRKALIVSIFARAFAASLGFLALPFYIRFLGIEAYGVVGLFASLQVLVAFMDMGLATTLTRELAGAGHNRERLEHGRDATVTFELAYLALAVLIGVVLAAVSPVVSHRWVKLEALAADDVALALQLGGIALACQWPSNLYTAGLAGLHRQISLAISSSALASLRVVLSLLALWYLPTLGSFFAAQITASLLQSAVMRVQMWRALALLGHRAAPHIALLRRLRGFAAGMTAITITSIFLVQMDKLILSHLLRLPDFGVYVIASTLASGLYVLISPVFSVIYPRLATSWITGDLQAISRLYHASSQTMAALIMPIATIMVYFPEQSLFVLTGDSTISAEGAWVLIWLVIGSALNGLMNVPYAMQLAAGWTGLTVSINVAAVLLLAPLTWWLAKHLGAAGGAIAWFMLNLGYLLVTPQLMHKRLLSNEKLNWYWNCIFIPAAACMATVGVLWLLSHENLSRWAIAIRLFMYWLVTTVVAIVCLPRIRESALQFFLKK